MNEKDLDEMQLPKVNERKDESRSHQDALRVILRLAIRNFENDTNYKFEPYEIDNVLLDMVKRSHESYLTSKFGNDVD